MLEDSDFLLNTYVGTMAGLGGLRLLLLVTVVQGRIVDIHREVSNIVNYHNNERRDRQLSASNMLEMKWDHGLARQAEQYSKRCKYIRPRPHEFDVGSNLYVEQDLVHGADTVQRMINISMETWAAPKTVYLYGVKCGRACSYVQMITAQTKRVGCALNTCDALHTRSQSLRHVTLFVCFYSPRTNLMDLVPFIKGKPCSQCPAGTFCHRGLCSQKDTLTLIEIHQLTSAHNRIRRANSRDPLEWDSYLERWALYVVNCSSDYPGPAHAFTNFERLKRVDDLYQKVCSWSTEGYIANIQLIYACRTPYDSSRCNHYTNAWRPGHGLGDGIVHCSLQACLRRPLKVLQPMLTSMACAAHVCSDHTRQLVCIYDNKVNRVLRHPHSWQ